MRSARRRRGRGAGWWLIGGAVVGVSACGFPDFAVREQVGASLSGAAGSVLVGAAAGGSSSSGAAGTAGTAASGGGSASAGSTNAGAAGEPALVQTAPWSGAALDDFGFDLLGSATLDSDGVTITHVDHNGEVGAVVQRQELDFAVEPELHLAIDFRIQPGMPNGDGMAVIIHASRDGYKALGSGGGGLGYATLKPCVAVEVDTAEVAATDFPAPHLGLMLGCIPEVQGPTTTALGGDPSDGKDWTLRIDWDRTTGIMNIVLQNVATGHQATINEPVDLPMLMLGKAIVAVAAATGEFRATQSVKSLELSGGGLSPRKLANQSVAP